MLYDIEKHTNKVYVWYVYYLIDPRDNCIFYVGKGIGRRCYTHYRRALTWRKNGKILNKVNKKLYNKILSIHDQNNQIDYKFIAFFSIEKDALEFEINEIKEIGIENLCNLTLGGEGQTPCKETLEKMSTSISSFWNSEKGKLMRKKFSEMRKGSLNPRYGTKESEEHKINRMKKMLETPRWNKGLKGDLRMKGPPKGIPSLNSISCSLIHDNGNIIVARSLHELSRLSDVSISTINRLRNKTILKSRSGWRIEINESI